MAIRATDAAAELLRLACCARRPMGAYEIVALTIIANGWNLANKGEPLIQEPVTCGNHAPEVQGIDASLTRRHGYVVAVEATRAVPAPEASLLAGVYGIYGRMGEIALRSLFARPDSPWSIARGAGRTHQPLDQDAIAQHYAQLRRERDDMLSASYEAA